MTCKTQRFTNGWLTSGEYPPPRHAAGSKSAPAPLSHPLLPIPRPSYKTHTVYSLNIFLHPKYNTNVMGRLVHTSLGSRITYLTIMQQL